MGATSTASGRLDVNLFLSEKRGGNSHFGIFLVSAVLGIWRFSIANRSLLPISMQTKQDPREPVLPRALKIMLHAKLCLPVIIFLNCVCWHPERICRALSSWGQRLIECLNHTACFWLYRVPVLYFITMHLVSTGTKKLLGERCKRLHWQCLFDKGLVVFMVVCYGIDIS